MRSGGSSVISARLTDVTSITVENPTFRLEIGALCARARVQAVPQGIEIFESPQPGAIMKHLFVSAVVLLSACSTVQPTDPFAHLCPAQSSESCPGDTNTPIVLSGPRQAQS